MLTKLRIWWFIRRLEANSYSAQCYAAQMLGKLGDSRAVEPLIRALLQTPYLPVRDIAIESLREIGTSQTVEALCRAVGKGEGGFDGVRRIIRNAIIELGDARVFAILVDALDANENGDEEVDEDIAEILGQLGDTRALEPLISMLDNEVVRVRNTAVIALGRLGDARAVAPLIRALGAEEGWIRANAAKSLGKLGEPKWSELVHEDIEDFKRLRGSGDPRAAEPLSRAVERLIRDLPDRNAYIGAANAARVLGGLGDTRAVEPLIRVLGDWTGSPASVRCAAAESLGELGDTRAVEPLIGALSDSANSNRLAAAKSLGKLGEPKWSEWVHGDDEDFNRLGSSGEPRAVEVLICTLGYGYCRKNTAKILERMGEPKWSRLVFGYRHSEDDYNLFKSGDPHLFDIFIRVSGPEAGHDLAVLMLGGLNDLRAVEPLINIIGKNRSFDARNYAIEALGKLGDRRAVEPLVCLVNDGSEEIRVRIPAIEALGKLGDRRAVEPLICLLKDKLPGRRWEMSESNVCSKAIEALGKLGDRRAVAPLIRVVEGPPYTDWWIDLAEHQEGSHNAKTNAIIALGELGDPSAIKPLVRALHHNFGRKHIVDALAKLGEPQYRTHEPSKAG